MSSAALAKAHEDILQHCELIRLTSSIIDDTIPANTEYGHYIGCDWLNPVKSHNMETCKCASIRFAEIAAKKCQTALEFLTNK